MNKKPVVFNKTLIIGIIILFVGIGISPVITAVDNDTDDVNDESIDNSEIGTSDEYEEIFTHIAGAGTLSWIKRWGFFRGEVILKGDEVYGPFALFGLRRSNGRLEIFFEDLVDFVHAYRFIGWEYHWTAPYGVYGFAFGNIDWIKSWEPK